MKRHVVWRRIITGVIIIIIIIIIITIIIIKLLSRSFLFIFKEDMII